MQAVRRALSLVLAPGKAWTVIAAEGGAHRQVLGGHALLLSVLFLTFLVLQYATGGLRPEVTVSGQAPFRMDGTQAVPVTNVAVALSGGQTALLLFTLCLISGALMYWLVLAQAELHGAARDRGAALRLVAYAMTPGTIGSLLYALPLVGWLLALAGYVLTVRLFRRGAPILLPPLPQETSRFGRVVGRRAAFLGLALPLLAFIGGVFVLSTLFTQPVVPRFNT